MEAEVVEGLTTLSSEMTVDGLLAVTLKTLEEKGIMVFAVVDHSGEAEKRGLTMRPTKLVIFGNPQAGTPLMQEAPTAAIDLPLKFLIWEDEAGLTRLSYNDAAYIGERHGVEGELLKPIAGAAGLASMLANHPAS